MTEYIVQKLTENANWNSYATTRSFLEAKLICGNFQRQEPCNKYRVIIRVEEQVYPDEEKEG